MHFTFIALFISSLAFVLSETCPESNESENTCDTYCFQLVKPLVEHAALLQQQVNSEDDNHNMNSQTKLENIQDELTGLLSLAHASVKPKAQAQLERFQNIGSKCYYIEQNKEVNWITAVHKCHEYGGHLASLQNENEFQLLKENLDNQRNYWIDVNDISDEGVYISHTTGLPAPFLKWCPSYDSDNNGDIEHCVHLSNVNRTLLMNDFNCHSLLYFICEL